MEFEVLGNRHWNETSSPFPDSQADFKKECLTEATERHLCENTQEELSFQCDFPRNFSDVNIAGNFSPMEITHLSVTAVTCVIALIGNLLVVTAVPLDGALRAPIHSFLVNLSVADILVSVVCLWDNALRSLSYNYLLGPVGCKAGGFIHMTCLLVSVLTLAGIAVDRVYAVLLPFQARHTPPRPKWVISAIWGLSVAAAAPFCALREYREYKWNDFSEIQCTYNKGRGVYSPELSPPCAPGFNYVNAYHIMVTFLLFFIPIFIIILAYVLILFKLWKNGGIIEESRMNSKVHIEAKKKVVRLALVVLSAFLVCWTPLQVLILMSVFEVNQHRVLSADDHRFWVYFVAYTNSALNPIIYGGFNQNYRSCLLKGACFRSTRTGRLLSLSTFKGRDTFAGYSKSEFALKKQRQSVGTLVSNQFDALPCQNPEEPQVQETSDIQNELDFAV